MSQRGQEETLFGHPVGLFTLFFAEMWERFSYYGMRSLLVFYMIKGFLGLNDGQAYGVYGAYTALVYATPFIGGIVADKLLGQRHAVILGGALMAAGHLLMGVESSTPFYIALALLVVGNGFFKPNISTMVGSLYPSGSERRDAGFTLFYMGINLGAAMSPLICGYIGETYGWHYGFGLATGGMLVGLLIFIAPRQVNMFTISVGALGAASTLIMISEPGPFRVLNSLIAGAMVIAAVIAVTALSRGGLPDWAGLQPQGAKNMGLAAVIPVYIVTALAIPAIAFLLRRDQLAGYVLSIFGGIALIWLLYQIITRPKIERERLLVVLVLMFFSMLFWAFFEQAGSSVTNFTDRNVDRVSEERVLTEADIGQTLTLDLNQAQLGYPIPGFGILTIDELDRLRAGGIDRAGKEKPGFLAYQVDEGDLGKKVKVVEQYYLERELTEDDIGVTLKVKFDKNLIGLELPGQGVLDEAQIAALKEAAEKAEGNGLLEFKVDSQAVGKTVTSVQRYKVPEAATEGEDANREGPQWRVLDERDLGETLIVEVNDTLVGSELAELGVLDAEAVERLAKGEVNVLIGEEHVGMPIGGTETPASIFQSLNPTFILTFGLVFSGLWTWLASKNIEPNIPVKFSLGLTQLGLGFGAFYIGAQQATEQGMVWMGWLVLGYMLHTTGELCISPVGLSMVTKLSPANIVSTVMGSWFLALAFSNYLAAVIAQFTGVSHGGESVGAASIPPPAETLGIYTPVFYNICLASLTGAAICFVLSFFLAGWMHKDEPTA
ncbi:MAG: oligopeptide:H+ symporter [Vulcanimicrobiota bacterium]